MSKPIIAQCPACNARYSVTPGQLRVADGQVRCGQCLTVFDAVPKAAKMTPAPVKITEPSNTQQEHIEETPAHRSLDQFEITQPKKAPLKSTQPEHQLIAQPHSEIRPQKVKRLEPIQPSLMTQIRALKVEPPKLDDYVEKPASQGWAMIGCLVALLLIAGQYLWFERAKLSIDPLLTPIYLMSCQHINCTLSSASGLDALNTTHLVVREVADQPETLELLTGIHNTLNLPVHLPKLRLQFTDINGRVIAARDITATTYRPESEVIQPNEKLDIRLLIKRPRAGHLGYEIDWIAHPLL